MDSQGGMPRVRTRDIFRHSLRREAVLTQNQKLSAMPAGVKMPRRMLTTIIGMATTGQTIRAIASSTHSSTATSRSLVLLIAIQSSDLIGTTTASGCPVVSTLKSHCGIGRPAPIGAGIAGTIIRFMKTRIISVGTCSTTFTRASMSMSNTWECKVGKAEMGARINPICIGQGCAMRITRSLACYS